MLKILMAASEAAPFAKSGGLADVLGSLPAALNRQGVDARVIMPKYGTIPLDLKDRMLHKHTIYVNVGWKNQYCGIEQAEYNGVTYYFIDNEYYFKREGLYGYYDEAERFAFFCRAVLEALPWLDFQPDILHCHDWQGGMIPVLLEAHYRNLDPYRDISTMFTIHNLKYQGEFTIQTFRDMFGLGEDYFTSDKLEFYGNASFLKGGLVYSHVLTTVSGTYAEEIQDSFYGERLDGLLRARRSSLHGIVNGIDYKEYNPEADPFLYKNYNRENLAAKIENKTALQRDLDLPVNEEIPVIGLISRLVDQKGLDLIACVLDEILEEDLQFIVLGTGDHRYEQLFRDAASRFPGKVSANIRFDNGLAHKIYAAADLFLMPSLFEPCGLGQIISLRYGTLPIVRETGGLKDTVFSYNEITGEGNGFSFTNYNAHDMLYTIRRALTIYRDKAVWAKLQRAAMAGDYSWQHSAERYIDLYRSMRGR
jgi:starch synthase